MQEHNQDTTPATFFSSNANIGGGIIEPDQVPMMSAQWVACTCATTSDNLKAGTDYVMGVECYQRMFHGKQYLVTAGLPSQYMHLTQTTSDRHSSNKVCHVLLATSIESLQPK